MTVKDAVKESLVGSSTDQSQPSHQAKTNFLRHARKDEGTEDLYMTEDDFINAIAPKHEDYVSVVLYSCCDNDDVSSPPRSSHDLQLT